MENEKDEKTVVTLRISGPAPTGPVEEDLLSHLKGQCPELNVVSVEFLGENIVEADPIERVILLFDSLEAFVTTWGLIANSPINSPVLSNARKIVHFVRENLVRNVAQRIYEHTKFLGDQPRQEKDWKTAETLVWKNIGSKGIIEATVLLIILRANQIETGNSVPHEIVSRMDFWRDRQLRPIIDFLSSLPSDHLNELICRATDEIPGDDFFTNLVTGEIAWRNGFLDWIRQRPAGARGCECGIHVPVPECYEVTNCP